MVTELEGGCFVTHLRAGEPLVNDRLRVWRVVGAVSGRISLWTLEFAAGDTGPMKTLACDELWYVLEGSASLSLGGREHELGPHSGIYLAAESLLALRTPGPLLVLSARCPEPQASAPFATADETRLATSSLSDRVPIVRLSDRNTQRTGDRWYRVLVDRDVGCDRVTQFVGSIPPGRAPDHFHEYEEVLCILDGSGRMWAGAKHAPLRSGSCVYLPRGQMHCVENTGSERLRLMGVFYPAGSPAQRYESSDSAGPSERRRPRLTP